MPDLVDFIFSKSVGFVLQEIKQLIANEKTQKFDSLERENEPINLSLEKFENWYS